MVLIAAFVALVFVYSLLSRRLERTVVTAPILFTVGGMLMALVPAESTELALDRAGFLLIAELGLVMTLFTDAARIAPRMLAGAANLPMRLLSTGMLLTLLLGALCAMVVFGDLSWWEAGILTAILAPTDAGLGQVIVNSPRVPQRIRQALNVEAGLNDGLSVPFLLFFIALAEVEGQGVLGQGILLRFLGEQLGYGLLIGLGVGLAGGWQGTEGWVHQSMLSGTRTAVVMDQVRVLHRKPQDAAPAVAKLEPGVVGELVSCEGPWCEMDVAGFRGWIKRAEIWGAGDAGNFD